MVLLQKSWTNNVHNLLRELGLPYMIDKNIVSRLDLNLIIQRIHDQYIQSWFLDQSPKLLTNRLFTTSFCYEPYLFRINKYNLRTCLSPFRCINRTEHKVYFHINTLFTNICDRVIIDSWHKIIYIYKLTSLYIYIFKYFQGLMLNTCIITECSVY